MLLLPSTLNPFFFPECSEDNAKQTESCTSCKVMTGVKILLCKRGKKKARLAAVGCRHKERLGTCASSEGFRQPKCRPDQQSLFFARR